MNDILVLFENDNIYSTLNKKGIDTRKISTQLNIIGSKAYNNKIGYFQFKVGTEFYKILILPKICKIKSTEIFISLLNEYYKLSKKYNGISLQYIKDNYIDFVIPSEINNIQSIESLVIIKYIIALKNIRHFFKNLKSFGRIENSVILQDIKYNLDIKKNIFEINKANVHQIKNEKINYSLLANISYCIIENFIKYKMPSLYYEDHIVREAYSTKTFLQKKFSCNFIKINYSLFTQKYKKYFLHTDSEKLLYSSLLTLLGEEGYFDEDIDTALYDKINIVSIIFQPDIMYEYLVYEHLLKKYGEDNVYFNRIHGNTINYLFMCERNNEGIIISKLFRDSIPDFVVHTYEGIVVCDAKWKIINSLNDITINDITKLVIDCSIREAKYGILIYPSINEEININNNNYVNMFDINENNYLDNQFYFKIDECRSSNLLE